MARITPATGKGPHVPEFHSAPGIPSPENMKLPQHSRSGGDHKKFVDLLPHIAPHSTLGEIAAACGGLNKTEAGLFAAFLALSGGQNTKFGNILQKHSKDLSGAALPDLALTALAQTLVEEGYKP